MPKTKKNMYNDELYFKIRQDLLDQLENNGTVGKQYEDMIEDYMNFWVTKNLLQEDIKKRGVTVKYQNGKDQWGHKKNDSIAELVKVNAQMLKILSELNLKPSKESGKNEPAPSEEDYY